MNTLCVGGSFNPIHYAHLRCAVTAMALKAFDRVLLIPSAQPPHKAAAVDLASAEDRLAMCRAAVEGDPRFAVDDLELRRTGPSYTFDTARELKQRGWPTVSWMIGADQLLSLPSWHLADELIREVNFVIVARPGWSLDWSTLPPAYQFLKSNVVEAPLIDISATDIRRRVKAGESIDGLTPPAVVRYIAEHALYR
jgi:nicotinate-nucleotide adenylyltransferase